MEAEQEVLGKILQGLDKLRTRVDTSFIEGLIARLSKTADKEMQRFLILKIIQEYERLEQLFPNLDASYPLIKVKEGIEVGNLLYKGQPISRFSLSVEDLNRNVLVIGSTGHGKTSLIMNILLQAEKQGVNYLCFDMKKDYQFLGLSKNTVYISSSNIKINPLEPPKDVSMQEWAVHFADVFSDSFALLVGSRDYLLENTMGLFSEWDKQYPPSLSDLLKYIEVYGRRNDYFKVVRGRISGLLMATEIFDCNNGISFEKLNDKNIVLSMEKFGQPEGHFLVSLVLSRFYYHSLAKGRSSSFKRVFVIDDAHMILDANQEKDYAKGIPILQYILSKIREFGYGFIFSDQQISSIISSAIQNTNTKFIGKVNLLPDLYKILPAEYKLAPEIGNSENGEFIVINDSVYPFSVFKADLVKTEKYVRSDLIGLKEKIDSDFFVYFKNSDKDLKEKELLEEISKNPGSNLRGHQLALEKIINKEDFNTLKNKLISEGIISELSILMEDEKTHKFLFIKSAPNEGLSNNNLMYFDEKSFFSYLMRELVARHLKSRKISFQEEVSGFLIKGLIKTYIFIEQDVIALSKLLETRFDRVIFIVNDNMNKDDIIADMLKEGDAASLLNFKTLNLMYFYEFKKAF
ncbi:MAG: hypothetical protein BJBARM5_0382 [Candidatus Parvarchaeum acidophilus ARMAN-5]|uniref:Helicase HerA central domain-containing protein n=1 Tax=Candidatus Parvarchaeum acidophilus ARMAN-5 TaxID=662762 RepID=D6GV75_PARA5|nr:MAG: hypothetical protein BJBARM5_0382 [Candidatus Parvarchaeum acidophilus ARMAN-5]